MNNMKYLTILFLIFILLGCSKEGTVEERQYEPDLKKRQEQARDKTGGIFGTLDRGKQSNTFEFSTSNVLWRATLKSLDFLPLLNADYTGGIIITDWYNEKINSKESIKLTIKFLSNEIRSDSIEIIAHKKFCETIDRCQIGLLDKKFSQEIKDTIITNARAIKIAEEKKKK